MGGRTSVEYRGVKYSSISEACRQNGGDIEFVSRRMREGMTFEEALNAPVVHASPRESVVVAGVRYKTRAEACKAHKIATDVVTYRVNKLGMSVEDAILTPVASRPRRVIDYKEHHFDSVTKFAKFVNLPIRTLTYWLDAGLSPEDAVQKILDNRELGVGKGKKLKYRDEEYSSGAELCTKKGISYSAFMQRLNKGMTVEEAVDTEIRETVLFKTGVVVDNIYYATVYDACNAYEERYQTVYQRMRKYDISFEEAILCGVVKATGYEVFGKSYKTMLAACSAYSVSFRDVHELMISGRSFEDALTYIVNERGVGVSKHYILQRQLCYGKYMLYKCKICGRLVMLSSSAKCSLSHSDTCIEFEWKA